MYSAISRAVGRILRMVLSDETQGNNLPDSSTLLNTCATDSIFSRNIDQEDVLLTDLLDKEEKEMGCHTITFTGQLTQLFCEHGLIDGEVYFSAESVVGSSILHVGDTVHVVARQQNKDGGWSAESVSLVSSSWEDDTPTADPVTGEVGKVTEFKDGEGTINQNIIFSVSDCVEGYLPYVGDWVSVELCTTDSDAEVDKGDDLPSHMKGCLFTASKVAPLRRWSFEGYVSASLPDHGYIDEEVFFRPDACLNGYRPRKWDQVKVTAIESKQGRCSWRAITISPLSSDSGVYRSKFLHQPRGRGRGWVIPGQKPQNLVRPHRMTIPNKLPLYLVPEKLRECVFDQLELTSLAPNLAQKLNRDNYCERMATLLHLEEIQMELNIQEFDLFRVCLKPAGAYLALHVPGLAEGRPSLLIEDSVILSSPADPDQPQYEGIIHEIHNDKVLLKFNPEFHCSYNGEDYNVTFKFNRVSLRRCHQACHLALTRLGDKVLFPLQEQLKPPQVDFLSSLHTSHKPSVHASSNHCFPIISHAIQDNVQFYNPLLNERQKTAVIQILLGQCRPQPYIIFGPPGTGKTITVVESIIQIFTHVPSSRIIACTPSNSAADLLVEHLHKSEIIKKSDMIRLNAFQRFSTGISDIVMPYCCTGEEMDMVCRYRIIVATCATAGLLYTGGLRTGHFTHVFVDEAGQATEPECLIPMGLIDGADGQIVLAGDPKQLGPVLMSPFAKMYGLELSYLERLMEHPGYQFNSQAYAEHGGYNPYLVTMLIDNYRCHQSILALPSKLFYHGYLRECGSTELTHTLQDWFMLPTPGIPVVFHGVESKDMREEDSPSWFNPGEVVQVIQYLQGLLGNKSPVQPDDIGIITPYRKQVEKIRSYIEILGIPKVKVGSVEEFQGQERQAMIISTVRSNNRIVQSDVRHVLGFVSNPKRFNVAITRAQALVVVVGNPNVLSVDKHWHSFIQTCVENGSYRGCEIPKDFLKTGPGRQQTRNHQVNRGNKDSEAAKQNTSDANYSSAQ